MNQLSFGAAGGEGGGDACGRCFRITGTHDPYTADYVVPDTPVVVKVTDLCPCASNEMWCGQTEARPYNQLGASVQ
jgi:hypothetical protein